MRVTGILSKIDTCNIGISIMCRNIGPSRFAGLGIKLLILKLVLFFSRLWLVATFAMTM